MTLFYLGIFAVAVLASFVLTRYVRNLAMGRGWVSGPALERHLHNRPLPRLGGVAIFLSFLISIGIAGIAQFSIASAELRIFVEGSIHYPSARPSDFSVGPL